ncbi:MAG: TonB-dependent siderophore receptor [Steroidobacteraceae bacterium]
MSIKHLVRRGLLAGAGFAGAVGVGGGAAADPATEIEEVVVTGRYEVQQLSSAKFQRPLIDTAQTASVVPDQLLIEQGRRTLRDSLRNITGISLHAGEGNPPGGGDALSIRGFSARDDVFVDGQRDPGNYFRDPFSSERIEVTKGAGSAIAGRGNIGGTVNIVSRRPQLESIFEPELSIGTDDMYRATVDFNQVLSSDHGSALRINAMSHQSDEPGRDVVTNERWGFAPSIAWGIGSATEFILSYLHQEQDDLPDFGLPNARNASLAGSGQEGRVAPVARSNFYGYSNDYRDILVDLVTLGFRHDFSDATTLRSSIRYGRVENDSIMSAPRFVGSVTALDETTLAVGNRKPRDQVDEILINQTDLSVDFDTGALAHKLVAGFEVSSESSDNRRRLDSNGSEMSLFDPVLQSADPIAYNGTSARLETDVVSGYVFDSVELSPRWIVNGGVRWDHVDTSVRSFDRDGIAPGFVVDLSASDAEPSWNGSLVFKATPSSSIYAAYGTSFETSGRAEIVQLAGGNNNPPTTADAFEVDPELARGFEFGVKHDARDGRLALAAALFEIRKSDVRTPGVNPGDPAVVLDGEQRVRGFEATVVGAVNDRWNVFAGYTYLDGEVTRSNVPFEVGQPLDNTPEHSLSVWTSFVLTPAWSVGGGVQYVDERTSNIASSPTGNITITADSYTVLDAFIEYRATDQVTVRLNGYNLADEEYFLSFSSGQSIPSAGRSAVLSVSFKR